MNKIKQIYYAGLEFYDLWQEFWVFIKSQIGREDASFILHIPHEDWKEYSTMCSWVKEQPFNPMSNITVIKSNELESGHIKACIFNNNEKIEIPINISIEEKKEGTDEREKDIELW